MHLCSTNRKLPFPNQGTYVWHLFLGHTLLLGRFYSQLPPPRTGGATSLTGLALGFWAPRYRKFAATTGAGLALPPQTLPSPPTSGTTGKIEHALWNCITQQIFYRELFYRSGAKNRKVPIGKFPMRKFSAGKFSIGKVAHREFCIGKLPVGRSGATSKTGLEHKEFPYEEILHKEIPYWGTWRHF